MNQFIFTKKSQKDLEKLNPEDGDRIIQKLKDLKAHPEILNLIVTLKEIFPITHRLRVGDFRLLMYLEKQIGKNCQFIITKVGHRRDVYR